MKKALSLFLSVLMLTSVVAAVDLSAYAYTSGDFEYSLSSGTAVITGYTGDASDLVIPTRLDNGCYVTEIKNAAFNSNTNITSVTISEGVITIGAYAFEYCTNLTSASIPESVTSIGSNIFYECSNLSNITVADENECYSSVDNVLFNKDMTELLCYPAGKSGAYTIPDTVTTMENYAFYECLNLTGITIPDSVENIPNCAFWGCTNLKTAVIGNGVTIIDRNAFNGCSTLTEITIPDSVTSIGNYAFNNCTSLTSVIIGNGVESIYDYAFSGCTSLTDLVLGENITSVGHHSFSECGNIKNVTIGKLFNNLDGYSFGMVFGSAVQNLTILDGAESIDDYEFQLYSSLVNIIIPDSVTSIGHNAFECCENLTTITIGSGVTSIGSNAFYKCYQLSDVYYNGSICDWTEISISNSGDSCLTGATIHYTGNSEHIWNNGTVYRSATCKTAGTTLYTCTVCGTVKYVDDIPKLEHVYEYVRTEPTCTKTGSIKKTCTLCGYVDSTETLAATGHSYDGGTVTKEATCKATGSKTYTCTVCGSTKKETIDKLTTHSYENKITKAKYDSNGGSNGKIEKKCSVCKNVKSTTTIYKPKSMSLSTSSYTYNGKAKKPTITVKDSKGNKISSKYYTVSYISQSTGKKVSSMKNPGKYYVKVTFKTRYSGSIKKAVTIKPKKTSIKSIKASKKGFTVKWGKVTTQTTGYQVQYSTSKNFKSATTTTISKNKTTGVKTAGLKAKKKYYVRVRTYKTVKINGKNTKIYSAWSSVKGVTTKK